MGSSCACGPDRGAPFFPRVAARGASASRCEPRPGRSGVLLPRRPPSKAKGIPRVLRIRGPRFGPVLPAFSHSAPRFRPLALGPVGSQAGWDRRRAQPPAPSLSRDLSASPRWFDGRLRHGLERSLERAQSGLGTAAAGLPGGDVACNARQAAAMTVGADAAIWVLTVYKKVLSPLLPRACRFEPTCSVYALEAIRKYGLAGGAGLAIKRLARCHPFHRGGIDPVP
jgi:putative membrane protein insertion efficiency factor